MNEKDNDIVVSVCIATYNQSDLVYEGVRKILEYPLNNIEVVVVDNFSKDKTSQKLNLINDKRFRFVENTENKGPVYNYMKALELGEGKYVMFSTDKDLIEPSNIGKLVNKLENLQNIVVGYCSLDYQQNEFDVEVYKKGINCLKAMGYLSKHPTGYFFRNSILKKLGLIENFTNFEKVGFFPFEFLCAEMSLIGDGAVFKMPLWRTRKLSDERKNDISLTYSPKNNNLYFFPEKRYEMFVKYANHLSDLELSQRYKNSMHRRLLYISYRSATIGYKNSIGSRLICRHYGTEIETIDKKRMYKIKKEFCQKYIYSFNESTKLIKQLNIVLIKFNLFGSEFLKKIKSLLRNNLD